MKRNIKKNNTEGKIKSFRAKEGYGEKLYWPTFSNKSNIINSISKKCRLKYINKILFS